MTSPGHGPGREAGLAGASSPAPSSRPRAEREVLGPAAGATSSSSMRSSAPSPTERWPSPCWRCAEAAGRCDASHWPWEKGTIRSALPCQIMTGTEISSKPKPHGLANARSSSSQPSAPTRTASRKLAAMSSANSPVSTARLTSGSSVSSEEATSAAVMSLSCSRSWSRYDRSSSSPWTAAENSTMFSSPMPAIQSRPSASWGATRDHQHGRRSAKPGSAGKSVGTTAGPASYQATFGADRGQHSGGVGNHVHHGPAGWRLDPHIQAAKSSPGEVRARAPLVPAPAPGWPRRASRGETPAETRRRAHLPAGPDAGHPATEHDQKPSCHNPDTSA